MYSQEIRKPRIDQFARLSAIWRGPTVLTSLSSAEAGAPLGRDLPWLRYAIRMLGCVATRLSPSCRGRRCGHLVVSGRLVSIDALDNVVA